MYKCYAYCPNSIISGEDYILKNINITNELEIYFEYIDSNTFDNFDEFLKFLRNNHSLFNISLNDIKLIEFVIFSKYKNDIINNYEKLDEFLENIAIFIFHIQVKIVIKQKLMIFLIN